MNPSCTVRCMIGAAFLFAAFTHALADEINTFYSGRILSMVIPTSPGGDVDARARLVARFMGRHIPGKAIIVPRNMPGAVGLQAANWLHALAPRDGTIIQAVMQSMPTHQLLDGRGVQFDAREFNWIGNTSDEPNTVVAWSATGVRTIDDVKHREVVVGAPGTYTNCVFYPLLMNALVGTRFKIISGYPGGNEVNLAMERGEVGARGCQALSAWSSTKPEWISEGRISILVQVRRARSPELPDVPLLTDLASNDDDRKILAFMSMDNSYGRPFATAPGTPRDRVMTLRRAFDRTMADEELQHEAEKMALKLTPSTGEEVQEVIDQVFATPREVIERTKAILAEASLVQRAK